ncbi:MAG: vWA domain-containing protein, partial [Gemmataceae bacterium]
MPSFDHWWFLLLLPVAPLPALVRMNRPRVRVVVPLAPEPGPGMERKPGSYWWWTGCVVCLLIALAGPKPRPDASESAGTLMVVLDGSGSMGDAFGPEGSPGPTRWSVARDAVEAVLGGLARIPSYRAWDCGLVVFARQPDLVLPAGGTPDALQTTLRGLSPTRTPGETSTHLGDALCSGLEALDTGTDGIQRRRMVLLVTDGEHNAQPSGETGDFTPRQAAQVAAALDTRVFILRVDNARSPEATRQAASQLLEEISQRTGGGLFSVPVEGEDVERLMENLGARGVGFWEMVWSWPWRAWMTVGSLGCALG